MHTGIFGQVFLCLCHNLSSCWVTDFKGSKINPFDSDNLRQSHTTGHFENAIRSQNSQVPTKTSYGKLSFDKAQKSDFLPLEWRNRKPTSIPGYPRSKTLDTKQKWKKYYSNWEDKHDLQAWHFHFLDFVGCWHSTQSWSQNLPTDLFLSEEMTQDSSLLLYETHSFSKAETSSWSFTVTQNSTKTELNWSFKGWQIDSAEYEVFTRNTGT